MSGELTPTDIRVGKIPNLIRLVNETTDAALKEIESQGLKKGEREIRKQEAIRDIVLKAAEKIEDLWNDAIAEHAVKKDETMPKGIVIQIGKEDPIIKKYANYFVRPLVDLMEVARKANVDVYEMKHGKKIQHIGEVETIESYFRRRIQELKEQQVVVAEVKQIGPADSGQTD